VSEEKFLAQLPLIERVIASVCRRNAFPAEESEEFASWAKLRLVDEDYAVFRKFQGRSSLPTYLTTVIVNLFRDYRTHRWGKWRPSAEARRLGEVAVQLETLVARDGRTLSEAITLLRTTFGVEQDEAELEKVAARLPARSRRRLEGDEALSRLAARESASDGVDEATRREAEQRTGAALTRAMAELEPAERLTLKLRFEDGLTVVEIAKLLGEPARPLYSRIEKALATLRRGLEADGVQASAAAGLIGWPGLDFQIDYGVSEGAPERGPSQEAERSP
jgi:RNA polymerase sigma factor for flagellar operon FliA